MTLTRRRRRRPARPDHRPRLPRAERERQALDAAHALFAQRGYGGVTMDDVADAVGVTKPLLYKYFGNKERLYLACMQPSGELLVQTVLDAVAPTATPADALHAGLLAFFDFLDTDRDAWRVLFDETLPVSGEVAQQVAAYRDRVTGLVATSVLGQMPPERRVMGRAEVEALSAAVLGAAEALGRWWLRTQAISARDAAELLISTVEPGLRARARRPDKLERGSRRPHDDDPVRVAGADDPAGVAGADNLAGAAGADDPAGVAGDNLERSLT